MINGELLESLAEEYAKRVAPPPKFARMSDAGSTTHQEIQDGGTDDRGIDDGDS